MFTDIYKYKKLIGYGAFGIVLKAEKLCSKGQGGTMANVAIKVQNLLLIQVIDC